MSNTPPWAADAIALGWQPPPGIHVSTYRSPIGILEYLYHRATDEFGWASRYEEHLCENKDWLVGHYRRLLEDVLLLGGVARITDAALAMEARRDAKWCDGEEEKEP